MTTSAEYQKQYEDLLAQVAAITVSWKETKTHQNEALDRLEQGHTEAEAEFEAVKARWAVEDEQRKNERWAIIERHAQGARDRDRLRIELGGQSKFNHPNDPRPEHDPAPEAERRYVDASEG